MYTIGKDESGLNEGIPYIYRREFKKPCPSFDNDDELKKALLMQDYDGVLVDAAIDYYNVLDQLMQLNPYNLNELSRIDYFTYLPTTMEYLNRCVNNEANTRRYLGLVKYMNTKNEKLGRFLASYAQFIANTHLVTYDSLAGILQDIESNYLLDESDNDSSDEG